MGNKAGARDCTNSSSGAEDCFLGPKPSTKEKKRLNEVCFRAKGGRVHKGSFKRDWL